LAAPQNTGSSASRHSRSAPVASSTARIANPTAIPITPEASRLRCSAGLILLTHAALPSRFGHDGSGLWVAANWAWLKYANLCRAFAVGHGIGRNRAAGDVIVGIHDELEDRVQFAE